jgi:uncharacterized membrane protein YfcA
MNWWSSWLDAISTDLSWTSWLLLAVAALGIGITKSGFSGVSLVHVLVFAYVFGARASTGVVLPMLIAGDVIAMWIYGKDADWKYVRRMMPPALVGVVLGWWWMGRLSEVYYRPLIGAIILGLAGLQLLRMRREAWFANVPHSQWFAWVMGMLVGITTMLANAAGPVFGLFLLAIGLPKREFVGTAAWFFLLLNVLKIPFSANLGLIQRETLMLNLVLLPLIVVGLGMGRAVIHRIPQRTFDTVILIFSAAAAIHMLVSSWLAHSIG